MVFTLRGVGCRRLTALSVEIGANVSEVTVRDGFWTDRSLRWLLVLLAIAAGIAVLAVADPFSESRPVQVGLLQDGGPASSLLVDELPNAVSGQPYSASLLALGADGATVSVADPSDLPQGVTVGTGGLISGTPNGGGFFRFDVTAELGGDEQTGQLLLRVNGPSLQSYNSELTAYLGESLTESLPVASSNGEVVELTSGSLPPGLALTDPSGIDPDECFCNPEYLLEGTPTAPGTYVSTLRATDADGAVTVSDLTVIVLDPQADSDGDGVLDRDDNCPDVANPGQENSNFDEEGDACDPDDAIVVSASASAGGPLFAEQSTTIEFVVTNRGFEDALDVRVAVAAIPGATYASNVGFSNCEVSVSTVECDLGEVAASGSVDAEITFVGNSQVGFGSQLVPYGFADGSAPILDRQFFLDGPTCPTTAGQATVCNNLGAVELAVAGPVVGSSNFTNSLAGSFVGLADGKLFYVDLVAGVRSVVSADIETGEVAVVVAGTRPEFDVHQPNQNDPFDHLAVSSDGSTLVFGPQGGTQDFVDPLYIVDVDTGAIETTLLDARSVQGRLLSVEVSPNGSKVYAEILEPFQPWQGTRLTYLDRDAAAGEWQVLVDIPEETGIFRKPTAVFLEDNNTLLYEEGETDRYLSAFSLNISTGETTDLEIGPLAAASPNGRFVVSDFGEVVDRDPDGDGAFDVANAASIYFSSFPNYAGSFDTPRPGDVDSRAWQDLFSVDNGGTVVQLAGVGFSRDCTELSSRSEAYGVLQYNVVDQVFEAWWPLSPHPLLGSGPTFNSVSPCFGSMRVGSLAQSAWVYTDQALLPDDADQLHDLYVTGSVAAGPLGIGLTPTGDFSLVPFDPANPSAGADYPECLANVSDGLTSFPRACFKVGEREAFIAEILADGDENDVIWIGRFDEEVVAP